MAVISVRDGALYPTPHPNTLFQAKTVEDLTFNLMAYLDIRASKFEWPLIEILYFAVLLPQLILI